MKRSETSDRVSSIAARYFSITTDQIRAFASDERSLHAFRDDIRSMAASLLRQDETKGLRGLVRKVFGR